MAAAPSNDARPTDPAPAPRRVAPIPEGWTLLHIGPPKTGTTAIQDAASTQRAELAELGILYPGRAQNHREAALELLGRPLPQVGGGYLTPGTAHRDELLGEIASGTHRRVLLSAETFGMATHAQARRTLDSLGDKVHVLIGLRNLHGYALSMWQQRIKTGASESLEDWLATALRTPGMLSLPGSDVFSEKDGFDVVSRWVDLVGPDRVTVVIPDRDRRMLFDVAEDLLDLPRRTLAAQDSNASLTAIEAELLRRVSAVGAEAGIARKVLRRFQLNGVSHALVRLRDKPPGERRILLPAAHAEAIATYGRRLEASIAASGPAVIGELDVISRMPERVAAHAPEPIVTVPRDLADAVFAGILRKVPAPAAAEPAEAAAAETSSLAGRLRGAVARRTGGATAPEWIVVGGATASSPWDADEPVMLGGTDASPRVAWIPPGADHEAAVRSLIRRGGRTRVLLLASAPLDGLSDEWRRRVSLGDASDLATLARAAADGRPSGAATAATLERWAAAVGGPRVTLAIGDDAPAHADAILGVPPGWLASELARRAPSRRLLEPAEAEWFSGLARVAPRILDPGDSRARSVLLAAIDAAVTAEPSAAWAEVAPAREVVDAAGRVADALAAAADATGCVVVGSRGPAASTPAAADRNGRADTVPFEVAVAALAGALVEGALPR